MTKLELLWMYDHFYGQKCVIILFLPKLRIVLPMV